MLGPDAPGETWRFEAEAERLPLRGRGWDQGAIPLALVHSISWELVSVAALNYHLNVPRPERSSPVCILSEPRQHFHGRKQRIFSVTSRAGFMSLRRWPFALVRGFRACLPSLGSPVHASEH